ncbi:MAG: LLM class flavin-dependent oxidoreductase, partial [Rhizobium oryzihabitans]
MTKKTVRFGIMLQGPGGHMNAWRHPKSPVNASVNFDFFRKTALKAEAAGIAFAFVADGLYINDKSIPHFLNRF